MFTKMPHGKWKLNGVLEKYINIFLHYMVTPPAEPKRSCSGFADMWPCSWHVTSLYIVSFFTYPTLTSVMSLWWEN